MTLNLVYPEKSDLAYKISKFPDGQQNITIEGLVVRHLETRTSSGDDEIHKVGSTVFNRHIETPVTISSRLNNWLHLEIIVASVAALRELGFENISLHVPYIVGGRSDRKFEEGGNNYIKHIIAPVLNSLNFKSITTIDPHSDILEACLNNFRKKSNEELVKFAFSKIGDFDARNIDNDFVIISPDAGASKKIFKLAESIDFTGDIITCTKDRDTNGKLTKTVVPDTWHWDKDKIIIDDICDGGRTFINIAEIIKADPNNKGKIYLIVTHGIFSAGFSKLSEYFDGIYCTNSYSDLPKWKEEDGKIITSGLTKVPDFVTQLNVF